MPPNASDHTVAFPNFSNAQRRQPCGSHARRLMSAPSTTCSACPKDRPRLRGRSAWRRTPTALGHPAARRHCAARIPADQGRSRRAVRGDSNSTRRSVGRHRTARPPGCRPVPGAGLETVSCETVSRSSIPSGGGAVQGTWFAPATRSSCGAGSRPSADRNRGSGVSRARRRPGRLGCRRRSRDPRCDVVGGWVGILAAVAFLTGACRRESGQSTVSCPVV